MPRAMSASARVPNDWTTTRLLCRMRALYAPDDIAHCECTPFHFPDKRANRKSGSRTQVTGNATYQIENAVKPVRIREPTQNLKLETKSSQAVCAFPLKQTLCLPSGQAITISPDCRRRETTAGKGV
jgi:hypothetical protein